MFIVFEETKSTGKRYRAFEHSDRFTCEVWMENHKYDTYALMNHRTQFVLVEVEDWRWRACR